MNLLRLHWRPEPDPPSPSGVVGVGAVARALRAKLDRPLSRAQTETRADDHAIAGDATAHASPEHAATTSAAAERTTTPTLMATAHADLLILTGPADALPWVDGARYIAPRPEAPMLWLPTHLRPDAPLDLLALALARKLPPAQAASSMLLWPDPAQLVPLHRALAASAAVLARIDAHWARG